MCPLNFVDETVDTEQYKNTTLNICKCFSCFNMVLNRGSSLCSLCNVLDVLSIDVNTIKMTGGLLYRDFFRENKLLLCLSMLKY